MSEFCFKEVLSETSWVNPEENHILNLKVIDAEDNRGSPNKVSKLFLQDKTKSCDDKSRISSILENSCQKLKSSKVGGWGLHGSVCFTEKTPFRPIFYYRVCQISVPYAPRNKRSVKSLSPQEPL